jgi:arginase
MSAAGIEISDAGDLPGGMFAVDHYRSAARNLPAVAKVAREVADAVAQEVSSGRRPLVIGGDCTITLGVVAGMRRVHPDAGLVYVDGDPDLDPLTPDASGILDATGIAQLLGHGEPELASLAGDMPMLSPSRLAIVGCDPHEMLPAYRDFLTSCGISCTEGPEIIADPEGAARGALSAVADADAGPLVVHFDVDVVDSADLPLGNFPHYGSGVRLDDVVRCLRVLVTDPSCGALVLTEVNPTHDPDGGQLERYVAAVVSALAA